MTALFGVPRLRGPVTVRHFHRERGFTLLGMVTSLFFFAVFAALASKLFMLTLGTMYAAGDAQSQVASVDHMIAVIRADVWSASEMRVADGRLVLTTPQGTITWRGDRWFRDSRGRYFRQER